MAEFTKREFLKGIVAGATITAEQEAFAVKEIAALDKRNEKRKATPSKTAIANEPIKADIVKLLTEKGVGIAATVAESLGITTQKASALLRQLTEEGVLVSDEVKVPKKGKVKAYRIKPELAEEGE